MQQIEQHKIIAIMRGLEKAYCLPAVQALYAGGIRLVEVTFNQKDPSTHKNTLEAIQQIRDEMAGKMCVGAGTVTSVELVRQAKEAGAGFMVSPDTNPEVIAYTRQEGLVSIPGALTATEALTAHRAGADYVKLFPAAMLGPAYLKALRSPLNHIRFLAVGGVDEKNMAAFLQAGAAGVGVGGCLVKQQWIQEGLFAELTALAKEFCQAIQ